PHRLRLQAREEQLPGDPPGRLRAGYRRRGEADRAGEPGGPDQRGADGDRAPLRDRGGREREADDAGAGGPDYRSYRGAGPPDPEQGHGEDPQRAGAELPGLWAGGRG